MKSKLFAVSLGAFVVVSLSGCDKVGRFLASKSFEKMEQKIAEQQELIDQMTIRLEASPALDETAAEAKRPDISSMFRRSRD